MLKESIFEAKAMKETDAIPEIFGVMYVAGIEGNEKIYREFCDKLFKVLNENYKMKDIGTKIIDNSKDSKIELEFL